MSGATSHSQYNDTQEGIQDLLAYLKRNTKYAKGVSGSNATIPFIPKSAIVEYFKDSTQVTRILREIFPEKDHLLVANIQNRHAITLCILLRIGKANYLESFMTRRNLFDEHLPFEHSTDSPPKGFPESGRDRNFSANFRQEQWMFCATGLDGEDTTLDDERVVPFVEVERLGQGGSAIIHKVRIHPDYDHLEVCSESCDVECRLVGITLIEICCAEPTNPISSRYGSER